MTASVMKVANIGNSSLWHANVLIMFSDSQPTLFCVRSTLHDQTQALEIAGFIV
jgi:hypothetical protein